MAPKKETTPEGKADLKRDKAQAAPRDMDDEFDEMDGGVQEAVTTDVNDFPEMGAMEDEVGEPHGGALLQDEELLEEDTIPIKNPEVAAELSEDPVRLYLRNIGQFKLLDSDSEFRLATMI